MKQQKQHWYIIRKRGTRRWTAYQLAAPPNLKRGYEAKGPFQSLVAAMMAAHAPDQAAPPRRTP